MWWKIISLHQNVSLQFTESLLKAALTWKALFRNIFQCFPWIQCSAKWHLEDIHWLLSACLAPFQDNLKKNCRILFTSAFNWHKLTGSGEAQFSWKGSLFLCFSFIFSFLLLSDFYLAVLLFIVVPSEKSTANWRRRKVHAVCFSFFSGAIFRWRKSYFHCKKWGFWTTNNDFVYSGTFRERIFHWRPPFNFFQLLLV